MRVLIIDNNIDKDCWGAEDLRQYARKFPNATLVTRRAPQNDLPKSPANFDRIIVSGSRTSSLDDSPWVGRLVQFTQAAIQTGKPFLGVCFGHQILARSLGSSASVGKANLPEFGWTQIEILQPSKLLQGLKNPFFSFSAHYEEITHLPSKLKKLAQSDLCKVQACQLEDLPVYGIQFHPEKTIQDAEKTFAEKRRERNVKPPLSLLNPKRSRELYDPKIAETIFSNFVNL